MRTIGLVAATMLLATGALAQDNTTTMQTDSATTAGGAATMDGTMPVDATPGGTGNAAEADKANTGETGNPVPGAATTTGDAATGGGMTGATTPQ